MSQKSDDPGGKDGPPQPSQKHMQVENKEEQGRPPHEAQRGDRTEVPVTSHLRDGVSGVGSPQDRADAEHRRKEGNDV